MSWATLPEAGILPGSLLGQHNAGWGSGLDQQLILQGQGSEREEQGDQKVDHREDKDWDWVLRKVCLWSSKLTFFFFKEAYLIYYVQERKGTEPAETITQQG